MFQFITDATTHSVVSNVLAVLSGYSAGFFVFRRMNTKHSE